MTLNRLLQLHQLEDTATSMARSHARASVNLSRIGNNRGSDIYLAKSYRAAALAERCRNRLSGAV